MQRSISTSTLQGNWKNRETWKWQFYQLWLVFSVQSPKIETWTGGHGCKRTSGDHPNCNISEIGQNTVKSPGDLLSHKLQRKTIIKLWCKKLSSSNYNKQSHRNIYLSIYIHYRPKVWDHTLNCSSDFIIKANFVIDHKVRSEPPKKNKSCLHIYAMLENHFCKCTFASY